MKKFLLFLLTILFIFSFSTTVNANEIYLEQYEKSGLEDVENQVPKEVKEIIDKYGITSKSYEWIEEFDFNNLFEEFKLLIISGGKKPLKALLLVLTIMLIWSATGHISLNENIKNISSFAVFVLSISVFALPIVSLVSSVVSAIKACGVFMLSFIPIFCSILLANGRSIASSGFSSVMMIFCQLLTFASTKVITPVCSMFLSLGISNVFLENFKLTEILVAFKKALVWCMSFLSVLFLGVLGVQNVIGASVDNTAMKTLKFVVGSTVPVVGNTLSESILTVKSCIDLLSSTAGIYAVIVVIAIIFPILIELLLWRFSLTIIKSISAILDCQKVVEFSKVADQTIALLIGIFLFILLIFVISVTIVSILGK